MPRPRVNTTANNFVARPMSAGEHPEEYLQKELERMYQVLSQQILELDKRKQDINKP